MNKTFYLTLFIAGMLVVFAGALLKISTQGVLLTNLLLLAGVLLEIAAFVVYAITRYKGT